MNTVNTQHHSNDKAIAAFHVAVLLDEQGHEIAITEEMIQRACEELAQRCHYPHQKAA